MWFCLVWSSARRDLEPTRLTAGALGVRSHAWSFSSHARCTVRSSRERRLRGAEALRRGLRQGCSGLESVAPRRRHAGEYRIADVAGASGRNADVAGAHRRSCHQYTGLHPGPPSDVGGRRCGASPRSGCEGGGRGREGGRRGHLLPRCQTCTIRQQGRGDDGSTDVEARSRGPRAMRVLLRRFHVQQPELSRVRRLRPRAGLRPSPRSAAAAGAPPAAAAAQTPTSPMPTPSSFTSTLPAASTAMPAAHSATTAAAAAIANANSDGDSCGDGRSACPLARVRRGC